MTIGEQIAAAIMGFSGVSSIGCAIRAYLPIRSAHEAEERLGSSLNEAFGSEATSPVPDEMMGLLDQIDAARKP